MLSARSSTGVLLINEIDKATAKGRDGQVGSGDVLLTLLDRQGFFDNYLEDSFPTDGLFAVATCNDVDKLSKPLRVGIGQKHSLGVEMGTKDLKALLTFAYNDVQGAMKGSKRDIITGDMNANPGTPEIEMFTSFENHGRQSIDATKELGGTFHAFGQKKADEMPKIDYIFTDMKCDISESRIIPDIPVEGKYISDHFPVEAFIETEE